MEPRILSLQYKQNYTYKLKFENGTAGDVNFEPFLFGEAFTKIKEKQYFKKAYINKETGAITWTNGVDISPEAVFLAIED